jgi:hypothetical protein
MHAAASAITILVSARAPKIRFCTSRVRDLPALLETAELGISLGPDPMIL